MIGIDSGGTKTDIVLFDETGHILCRDLTSGWTVTDIGPQEALRRAEEAIRKISARSPRPLRTIYGGIAGTDYYKEYLTDSLKTALGTDRLRLDGDNSNIISGVIGLADGCGMVCGTGSSLLIRKNRKICGHIGGRGYLIDSGGSGFDLGQEALRMAFRAMDGRGEKTVLLQLLEQTLDMRLDRAVPQIYASGRSGIASFARLVFTGYEMGDRISCEIVDRCSTRLAELTWAAQKSFSDEFYVIMGGGIFAAYPDYVKLVCAKSSRHAKMIPSDVPPVYGAAVEAMADAGFSCDAAFRENFLKDYQALSSAPAK